MNLRKKYKKKKGFVPLVENGDSVIKDITLGLLSLGSGESYKNSYPSHEICLVILGGKCSIKAGEENFEKIGKRENVFQGRAYAVYMPAGTEFTVTAETDCEIAVCGALSKKKTKVKLVTPEENKRKVVGKDNWQREVFDIIDLSVDAEKLVIGETVNPAGNWSSAPPHRHEKDNLPDEAKLEEVYLFKVNPEQGFGIQRVYTDDRSIDETYTIENNDTVLLPRGYHPVAAGPGYGLYYLWILAGEKRVMKVKDDPAHAWLKDT